MNKLFALLLALVMVLAMTACGKDEEGTPTGESTGVTTTNTAESTNDPTDGTQNSTQGTTENTVDSTQGDTQGTPESTIGGDTTDTTEPPTTTSPTTTPPTTPPTTDATEPPTTTPPTTTPPTTPPTTTESLYYNIVFKLNGKNLSTNQLKKGEKITVPSAGSNKWYVWDKQVPSTMPSSDLLFNAVAIAGDAWAATTWEYDFNGCLTIHGTGRMSNFSENSQPWKEYKLEITAVKFDNTITEIGKYAFFGLENLTTVVIPNNITIIGSYSFANCVNIQSITFGQNVKYIGTQAFASSFNINTVKFLGRKTWFVKQENYQTSITFSSYNNASLFREYNSYAFSYQENWWPNY